MASGGVLKRHRFDAKAFDKDQLAEIADGEAYNTFNHTQYAGINTSAQFNPAGQQVNAQFGQVTSTRLPRVMQGTLRFVF
jgi:hypothetical protein